MLLVLVDNWRSGHQYAADELNAEDATDDGDVDDEKLIVLLGSAAGT